MSKDVKKEEKSSKVVIIYQLISKETAVCLNDLFEQSLPNENRSKHALVQKLAQNIIFGIYTYQVYYDLSFR
jgi:hypothetical protein